MANDKRMSLSSAISDFIARRAIPGEMEQNLVKEAVHLHLLSALSETGVLRHVVFQGGTALRLCYGGERYSEDLDFVCGTAGAYVEKIEFGKLIREALETAKASLGRSFGIDLGQITLKQPDRPMAIKDSSISVVAWQIVVPILSTPHSPKSRIKIEFANVPAYDKTPKVARATPGLVQIPDVILNVESANEILSDKAVALVARQALKHRDIWDVWDLNDRLAAKADRDMVRKKFADYGTSEVETKAAQKIEELNKPSTTKSFLDEMARFLPPKRISEIRDTKLDKVIIGKSVELIRQVILPT
jgi:predicted nucleotidyltransferase component of viral defense system